MRLSVDVGGTFTDLVVDDGAGRLKVYKSPTTSPDPIEGVLDVVALAAAGEGRTTQALLAADRHVHPQHDAGHQCRGDGKDGPHRVSHHQGHPDILLVREGGRTDAFNYRVPYPAPYVPRSLTFEVDERIGADGRIVRPLAAASVHDIADRLQSGRCRGGRRLPAVVDRQSGPRAGGGERAGRAAAGRAGDLVASAQPVAARVPPRLVVLHRCVAEAA